MALRTLNPAVQITVQIALQIAVQNYVTELQIVVQCYCRNCTAFFGLCSVSSDCSIQLKLDFNLDSKIHSTQEFIYHSSWTTEHTLECGVLDIAQVALQVVL